jgi:hypothetical protein
MYSVVPFGPPKARLAADSGSRIRAINAPFGEKICTPSPERLAEGLQAAGRIPALHLVGPDVAEDQVPAVLPRDPDRAFDELHPAGQLPDGGALRKELVELRPIRDVEVRRLERGHDVTGAG